jgi:hypothetical protein
MRTPLVIYDFATDPFWIPYIWRKFSFLFYQCNLLLQKTNSSGPSCLFFSCRRLTSMALDIAKGLAYLAELKYVHRDVACRNCLGMTKTLILYVYTANADFVNIFSNIRRKNMFHCFFISVFFFFLFYVRYSKPLHLPPLGFHCVGGCWDQTQGWCDFGLGCIFIEQ